jgi:hypothetical protein
MNDDVIEDSDDFEFCVIIGYYAAYSGNSLQTFRDR